MIIDFNAHLFPGLQEMMERSGIDMAVVSEMPGVAGTPSPPAPPLPILGEGETAGCNRKCSLSTSIGGRATGGDEGYGTKDSAVQRVSAIPFAALTPQSNLQTLQSNPITGIRIYPTYHPWDLADTPLFSLAQEKRWIVQVYLRLLDPRVLQQSVDSVTVIQALEHVASDVDDVRFVVSGVTLREVAGHLHLFRRENVWTETAHIQHPMNSLPKLIDLIGSRRMLFGTNAPLFYPYAGVFRLEKAGLAECDRERIVEKNAMELLKTS